MAKWLSGRVAGWQPICPATYLPYGDLITKGIAIEKTFFYPEVNFFYPEVNFLLTKWADYGIVGLNVYAYPHIVYKYAIMQIIFVCDPVSLHPPMPIG